MNVLLQTLFKPVLIGLLDAIEYTWFNKSVFYVHNFPDIVPDMKPSALAAYCSGVKVSWFLFLPLGVLNWVLNVNPKVYFLFTMLEFLGCIGYMMKRSPGIYDNHVFFYKSFAVLELAAIAIGTIR